MTKFRTLENIFSIKIEDYLIIFLLLLYVWYSILSEENVFYYRHGSL